LITDELLARFLDFSAEVTAFSVFELQGTGQAAPYLSAVVGVLGEDIVGDLLDTYSRAVTGAGDDPAARARLLYRDVFSSETLGPVARNIIKLWYVGTWFELPAEWRESYGARENDVTFVVSPGSYMEGLLWPAVGANPPGAKAPGYGSWASPPRIPEIVSPLAAAGASTR